MKHIFIFVLMLSLSKISQGQEKDWTLLMYVVGTDIVEDAIRDIGEMQAAGNTDNINIVGLLGGADLDGWREPTASLFEDGEEYAVDFEAKDPFMVSVDNLTDFIDWGIENYPAKKYMIMFYNHGMAIRGWGWENVIDDQFNIIDLKTGIENTNFIQSGNKFELMGFDACLMGCIEAQSSFQDLAHYYIASEETEPWHAWNWTPVITAMNNQSNLTGDQLGRIIIDEYIQHSVDNNSHAVTLSLIELAKVADLVQSLEDLVLSLNDELYLSNFIRARGKSEEYSKSLSNPEQSEDMVDIGDLVAHLLELEPTLENEIKDVMQNLDETVIYERSDNTRPKATGISMYVPMNTLVDPSTIDYIVDSRYSTIPFSQTIKDFITQDYLDFALADDASINASLDNSLGFVASGLGPRFSAIKVDETHIKDLHQIQVVLLEEISNLPDEFIMLGSTHVDTTVVNSDGSVVFGYEWDEEWLSLNGVPAYVSDIQDFELKDSLDNIIHSFIRLHIPALLNPGSSDEKYIMFSYKIDSNFDYELEGILRESYMSGATLVTSKERIELKPGDQVQLLYEVIDHHNDSAYFIESENAVFDIQVGNSDLELGYSRLEAGKYHLGFVMMDHAHNDTIIYDPMIREIVMTSNEKVPMLDEGLMVYPNPTSNSVFVELSVGVTGQLTLVDATGRVVLNATLRNELQKRIDVSNLETGVYYLYLTTDNGYWAKEIYKQ